MDDAGTGGGVRTLASSVPPIDRAPAGGRTWLDRRHLIMAYALFLAYAAVDVPERKHHNASFQVFANGPDSCRLVWITDILPDTLAAAFAENMEKGLAVAKRQLEQEQSRRS